MRSREFSVIQREQNLAFQVERPLGMAGEGDSRLRRRFWRTKLKVKLAFELGMLPPGRVQGAAHQGLGMQNPDDPRNAWNRLHQGAEVQVFDLTVQNSLGAARCQGQEI